MGVQTQSVDKSNFCDVARGNGQHSHHAIRIIYFQPPTIKL